uniref:Uncharacterized protein n=1 Tax=Populus alba TaxID=43335 RepID=A0A4V6A1L8_POPAL|nr:hypothetical protein D5086_0000285170 [Populus alba]
MEGFPQSSMEDVVNVTSNPFDLQSLEDTFMSELLLSPPEVSGNQSTILCNDQGGQNNVINDSIQQTTLFPPSFPQTMTTMGDLDGTSSSWINQNEPNSPQAPSRYQPNHNLFDPQCANPLRIQFLSNQGQDDQAAVIPDIDNMQKENFVPQNSGNSTRSQMDNVQVRGLQNQTARTNASNPGLDTSLQSQIRGLNTQHGLLEGYKWEFRGCWNKVPGKRE